MSPQVVERSYAQAIQQGNYDLYTGNLFGKYDNVRIYWEDQLTRLVFRPFLTEMAARLQREKRKLRIVDLGSGTGQGYEIITKINKRDLDLGLYHNRVLEEEQVGLYLGLDLSQAMVERGNAFYRDKPQVRFVQGDLNEGLGAAAAEQPFDIYYSTYGSLSHLDTPGLRALLEDIAAHSRDGSLAALDLLGRYSIEWPGYWEAETDEEKYRDYSMSYLYADLAPDAAVDHFPLRFWTGPEIEAFVAEISAKTGVNLEVVQTFDRSLLVGRHVNTGEYNPHLRPIRRLICSLHEDYVRTNLEELILEEGLFPLHPDPYLDALFEQLVAGWNRLVSYCQNRLERNISLVELEGWSNYSAPLQFALMTLDRVINDTEWMWSGDPRANIIEPQLGYALRSLEAGLQQGQGCGHGLLVIVRVRK